MASKIMIKGRDDDNDSQLNITLLHIPVPSARLWNISEEWIGMANFLKRHTNSTCHFRRIAYNFLMQDIYQDLKRKVNSFVFIKICSYRK